jgi:hypothetical protein
MPQEERIGVGAAFQGSHLRVYTFLCQLLIAIVTFYYAIAISCAIGIYVTDLQQVARLLAILIDK